MLTNLLIHDSIKSPYFNSLPDVSLLTRIINPLRKHSAFILTQTAKIDLVKY